MEKVSLAGSTPLLKQLMQRVPTCTADKGGVPPHKCAVKLFEAGHERWPAAGAVLADARDASPMQRQNGHKQNGRTAEAPRKTSAAHPLAWLL